MSGRLAAWWHRAGRRAARGVPGVAAGERVLAAAPLVDGTRVTATDRALLVPTPVGVERIPWWQVSAASWEAETSRLVVTADTGAGARVRRLALAGEHRLPETVRERVQSSIVVSQRVPVGARSGARVVARAVPGEPDLRWQVLPEPGLDLSDPATRAALDEAVAELRSRTAR